MNIIVWGINYFPEVAGIGPFNVALCEYLARNGHDVDIVTAFPYYPEWKMRKEDGGRLFRTDIVNAVRVRRCWIYVPVVVSPLRRMAHEASFVVLSFLRVIALRRPSVIVVVSPPLLLGIASWWVSVLKQTPFVFHVQDLQPDAAVGLGMLRRGWLLRFLYLLEAIAYSRAARVSGISKGMIEMFKGKGIAEKKLIFSPNGVKLPAKLPNVGSFRKRWGIPNGTFLGVYSGNFGAKQGLDIIVEAAKILEGHNQEGSQSVALHKRIVIVLAGNGARRAALVREVQSAVLRNMLLLPLQPDLEYREMLADADCTLITQEAGTGSYFFPSKLLTSLAAAKPVMSVADEHSELAKAVRIGKFGINVPPRQPELLAEALICLALRKQRGGRRYRDESEQGHI